LEKWARGTDRSRSTAPATRAVTGGQPSASHQSERRRPWPRYILRSRSSTTSAPSTQSARPTAPAASSRSIPPRRGTLRHRGPASTPPRRRSSRSSRTSTSRCSSDRSDSRWIRLQHRPVLGPPPIPEREPEPVHLTIPRRKSRSRADRLSGIAPGPSGWCQRQLDDNPPLIALVVGTHSGKGAAEQLAGRHLQ
jgi:hypothetical protein